MASRFDIQIQLHFEGREISGSENLIDSRDVLKFLDIVESAIYASDRNDIYRVERALRQNGITLLPIVIDACLERLRHHRHKRLLLEEARPGSLALIGVVAAVSFFVIEKTIGESFAEGYKESDTHKKLKEVFRILVDEKTRFIVENLERLISSRKVRANVRRLSAAAQEQVVIVDILPREGASDGGDIPPLGQILE